MTDSDLPEEPAHHPAPANQPDAPSSTDPRQEVQQLRHKLQDYERWFEASDNQVRILERERRKLAAVLNGTDAGFLVLDASNRIVWTNRVFRTLFPGVNPKELSGAACCTVVCGRTTTCEACPGPRAFGTGQVAHHEMRLDVGGTTRYIYGTAMPIRSQSGEIEETIVMLQDVSDLEVLRQSQTALQSSEERFRSIFSTASAGMASLSPDGTFLQVNPALCALLGYSREELLRQTVYDVTHPDDLETTRRLFAECNAGVQSTLQVVKRYRRRDGSVCWGQTSASWLYDAEGRPVYSVALVQDVTERRLAEEALQAQKSQVLLLQQVAVAANEATSHQEAIRTCLDRVCAHTGWPLGHAWLRLNDEATLV
ncbi:MAG TPA: PAS domain S-box protein, partial [Candidatus Polarisedimenticolia bacterium]|nr:PAS domain S-box protein [Candidatus Polarisedimenticolia bacterium]